jgi:hypothetical protein
MWDEDIYLKGLEYFKSKRKKDAFAKEIYLLMKEIGYKDKYYTKSPMQIIASSIVTQLYGFKTTGVYRREIYECSKECKTKDEFIECLEKNISDKKILTDMCQQRIDALLSTLKEWNGKTDPVSLRKFLLVKGIGEWTWGNISINIAMFSEANNKLPNILIQGDPVVKRGLYDIFVNRIGDKDFIPYSNTIYELEDKYSPYCGFITWYLWQKYNDIDSDEIGISYYDKKLWKKMGPKRKTTNVIIQKYLDKYKSDMSVSDIKKMYKEGDMKKMYGKSKSVIKFMVKHDIK